MSRISHKQLSKSNRWTKGPRHTIHFSSILAIPSCVHFVSAFLGSCCQVGQSPIGRGVMAGYQTCFDVYRRRVRHGHAGDAHLRRMVIICSGNAEDP